MWEEGERFRLVGMHLLTLSNNEKICSFIEIYSDKNPSLAELHQFYTFSHREKIVLKYLSVVRSMWNFVLKSAKHILRIKMKLQHTLPSVDHTSQIHNHI